MTEGNVFTLSTIAGGTPFPGPGGGGGVPHLVRSEDGGGGGLPLPEQHSVFCHAVGGVPLAFTQEAFLVLVWLCLLFVLSRFKSKLTQYQQGIFTLIRMPWVCDTPVWGLIKKQALLRENVSPCCILSMASWHVLPGRGGYPVLVLRGRGGTPVLVLVGGRGYPVLVLAMGWGVPLS